MIWFAGEAAFHPVLTDGRLQRDGWGGGEEIPHLRNSYDQNRGEKNKLLMEKSNGPSIWRAGQVWVSSGRHGWKDNMGRACSRFWTQMEGFAFCWVGSVDSLKSISCTKHVLSMYDVVRWSWMGKQRQALDHVPSWWTTVRQKGQRWELGSLLVQYRSKVAQ